ncbi:MAG TPA: alpha-1,4-glucan--maltose-1-phosphate maltosyltransferase [Mycobacteriales bacterium]|nr:alpha-1,4-glucan--maltose-1-phosphate maltosyltransferase [Mycobacteriales bacterium]
MSGRLGIVDITPSVSAGRYPARAVVGEALPVSATIFREGHDAVAANVVWRGPNRERAPFNRMHAGAPGTDRWHTTVVPTAAGLWSFYLEAWGDPWSTWRHAVEIKIGAGQDADELSNDLEIGARLLEKVSRRPERRAERATLTAAAAALRHADLDLPNRVEAALSETISGIFDRFPVRELITKSQRYEVWVDRERALYGSWYEFFPRSTGGLDEAGNPVHGTFATAQERLPAIAAMGFDVVYLPPIHPIGHINRKGKNNTLTPGPDDVGSPWAIGSYEGGHDAIHPELGTFADFDAFVARTRELGMEVALDLALQCAPDHPWAKEHPEWFTVLPDGTIAYAENPPKKYQDIYPINFDNDPEGIYAEVLRVARVWIEHGVKIFRVDNPHTKPLNFWHWLIAEIKKTDPDVLFLAEAFTRPAMMHALARVGFTQSYTYFTWRTGKDELVAYGEELRDGIDYMRPNFFVNTPDILHATLQYGGPPMFKIRAVLASMLSPTWGVYSGYELYEHVAVKPGSEEYLNSEKYELRPRDYAAAEREGQSLAPYLTRLNDIRRAHPALQQMRDLRFHPIDNDALLAFSKRTGEDLVLVIVSLDPHGIREATTALDMPALGLEWDAKFTVHDQITGASYEWGQSNYVRLDPHVEPAHIFVVERS